MKQIHKARVLCQVFSGEGGSAVQAEAKTLPMTDEFMFVD